MSLNLPTVIFRPGAEAELRDAYAWYEARESGLGSEFMRAVDASLQLVRHHPQISQRHPASRSSALSLFYFLSARRRQDHCSLCLSRLSRTDKMVAHEFLTFY